MRLSYIFRLDDVCPTMKWDNFFKLESIFDKYSIKPIIGVVPCNCDKKLMIDKYRDDFWKKIKELKSKNWIIAQHGYRHEYINKNSGVLKINNKSEFSGLSYKEQHKKISKGKEMLEKKLGFKIDWWMAPAHSFDNITCKVLNELGFVYITDGVALWPFRRNNLIWVPQQIWGLEEKNFGCWTICLHLNSLSEEFFGKLDDFISKNLGFCQNLDLSTNNCFLNNFYSVWWYFKLRFFRSNIYKFVKRIYE